jgi:hypothetical protein
MQQNCVSCCTLAVAGSSVQIFKERNETEERFQTDASGLRPRFEVVDMLQLSSDDCGMAHWTMIKWSRVAVHGSNVSDVDGHLRTRSTDRTFIRRPYQLSPPRSFHPDPSGLARKTQKLRSRPAGISRLQMVDCIITSRDYSECRAHHCRNT